MAAPTELTIVLVIALLVLGPKRLPAASVRSGHGIRGFRDSIAGRGPFGDAAVPAAGVADDAPAQSTEPAQ